MRSPITPSLNFLLLALVFLGTGAALWHGWVDGRLAVFVLVVSGWVVGLCLHEFGHALTAYRGGDTTVADTGYLTLDPLKYTDPLLSLILPVTLHLPRRLRPAGRRGLHPHEPAAQRRMGIRRVGGGAAHEPRVSRARRRASRGGAGE